MSFVFILTQYANMQDFHTWMCGDKNVWLFFYYCSSGNTLGSRRCMYYNNSIMLFYDDCI